MIDIKRIKSDRKKVEKALTKRIALEDLDFDVVIGLYEQIVSKQKDFETKRSEQKKYNKKISLMDKASDEFKIVISQLENLAKEIKELEHVVKTLEKELQAKLEIIPNIPFDEVPSGGKENNKVIKEWGEAPTFDFEPKDHVSLGKKLGILDFERATKLSGAHFPLYSGDGALLEWALIDFFMKSHWKDGYKCFIPPHLLNKESAYVAGQLPKFKEDVYWTQDNQCLLPTAETALCNIHRDEILDEEELPFKYFAYTPCYRREAGSYGKKERGLMRVHQFNKVEMFQYTKPENSNKALEELLQKAD